MTHHTIARGGGFMLALLGAEDDVKVQGKMRGGHGARFPACPPGRHDFLMHT
jgi:hypothetical protein